MSSQRADARARGVTVRDFLEHKQRGEPLVVVTAYDALFGRLVDEGGVDAVLVGDSLASVVAGLDSTLPITLDQMIWHAQAARRGVTRALLIVDMPFLTYQISAEDTLRNVGRVIQETGAQAVKLEGAGDQVVSGIRAVTNAGIPVMGHIGYTPQSVHALGGHRVQGRTSDDATRLIGEARRVEGAGAFAIVLELIPAEVAEQITAAVSIPTIGIGAGAACDGQVLVLHDLLGLNDRFAPKFLKRYATMAQDVRDAIGKFRDDVRGHRYPDDDHSF